MIKRLLLILILSGMTILSFGQNVSVRSFYLAETDLTANTPGTMVYDQNGNVCALIKIETTLDGFSFDVGTLGVKEVKRVGGEIWVYVPFGIRKITISHSQLGVIRDYQIPCAIDRGRTYIMSLVTGLVRTIVEQAPSKQFLYVELNPSEAILEIDGKIKVTDKGVYQELLPFGKYRYRAFCQDYHEAVGEIEVRDSSNTHTLNLNLKPAFGYISILSNTKYDISGASVYIDDKYVGEIPLNGTKLNSGAHRIRVIKEMYEAYNETVEVSDGEDKIVQPLLIPDFAEVTLLTSESADIYVNGELKGTHRWSGRMATGSYIFETRQQGHVPQKMSYDISRADQSKVIEISAPIPIYGSLVVLSTPPKARMLVGGEYVGETPKYIQKQVVGDYEITVELDGYERQTKKVSVLEGRESSESFVLKEKNSPSTNSGSISSNSKRVITSKEAEVYVGEVITASLIEGPVEKWEYEIEHNSFIVPFTKDSFLITNVGEITIWGYVKGTPMRFTLKIVNKEQQIKDDAITPNKDSFIVPEGAKVINSQTTLLAVGEKIVVKMPEGYVDRWESMYQAEDYITINNDGSFDVIKPGSFWVWGYVNGLPKIFKFKIKESATTIKTLQVINMRIGDIIRAELPTGAITRWEYLNNDADYISIREDVLEAKRAGEINIWGYVNSAPKLFTIIINNP